MNPAVTLAFAVVRRFPWKKVPVYWAAQMLGAFVASACVYGVYYGGLLENSPTDYENSAGSSVVLKQN